MTMVLHGESKPIAPRSKLEVFEVGESITSVSNFFHDRQNVPAS